MKTRRGFTLIELMIVVLVIALLAGLALSAYNKQVRKSRRAEAKQTLSDTALRQEKWRADHVKYLGTDSTTADKTSFGTLATSKYYDILITTAENATGWTATAVPKASTDQANDTCGTLSVQMAAGALNKLPTTQGCW